MRPRVWRGRSQAMVGSPTLRLVVLFTLLNCAACSSPGVKQSDDHNQGKEGGSARGALVSGFGLEVMHSGYIPLARCALPSPQRFRILAEKNFRASPLGADGWFEEAPELVKAFSVINYDGGALRLSPDGPAVQVDWETVTSPNLLHKPFTVLPHEPWFFERQCKVLEVFDEGYVRATMADGFVFEGYIVLCILKYDPAAFSNNLELVLGRSGPNGGWPPEFVLPNWPTLRVTEWTQFPDGRIESKPAPRRPFK